MKHSIRNQALKTFKPDAQEAANRWAAYWKGEMIDRPVLIARLAKPGYEFRPGSSYRDRVFGDMEMTLKDHLYNCQGMMYLGEAMPDFWISFGTHEIAAYCGGEIIWPESSTDTNWSRPFVDDWEKWLPLKLDDHNPLWQRLLEYYKKCNEILNGKVIPHSIDFHTNMDLLLSIRGDSQLCMDVIDCPEMIDRAMEDARQIFKYIWDKAREAGKMDEYGYWSDAFSEKSCTTLACDFSALIGPDMFRRWVLPTLEFEASLVDNVRFHWDGPAALRHFKDLMGIGKIHTISYVPNPFESHMQYIELYKRIQACGKAIEFTGTVDEVKAAHKELDPAKVIYRVNVDSQDEFESLEKWFKRNI